MNATRHLLALAACLCGLTLLTGCRYIASSSAVEDVATEGRGTRVYLYYAADDLIFRGKCLGNDINYSRDKCQGSPQHVSRKKFIDLISAGAGEKLPALEAKIEQLYVKIATIDSKLQSLVPVTEQPSQEQAALKTQMDAQEGIIAAKKLQLAGIDTQISAIKQSLATSPSNDLEKQLLTLGEERGQAAVAYNSERQKLTDLRQQFISSVGDLNNASLAQSLQAQRAQYQSQLMNEKESLDQEVEDVTSLGHVIGMLAFDDYPYEVTESTVGFTEEKKYVKRFHEIFGQLLPIMISSGGLHSCAAIGEVLKCWGANVEGELGNNSGANSLVPIDVTGLTSGVTAIALGASHSCVIAGSGGVKCWGHNLFGQLGNNSMLNSLVPIDVTGLTSGVTSIALGYRHSCAITSSGGVRCWGSNDFGQLGNNSPTKSLVPIDVTGLTSGVSAIALGTSHSCAITSSGGVKCWGFNGQGQLGNNSTTNSSVPIDVTGLTNGVTAIALGREHSCAITTSGGVKCWGSNSDGQLGNNSSTNSLVPVYVTGLTSGVTAIALGYSHSCVITNSGGVKCWGSYSYGQLGNNSSTNSLVPIDVTGLTSRVTAIALGSHHSCAATNRGEFMCWGYNAYGQLGNDSTTSSTIPVDVEY